MEGEFLEVPGISLDLVFTAGVALPRHGVQSSTKEADAAEREAYEHSVGPGDAGQDGSETGEHGGLVQAVADRDPTGGFVSELAGLDHDAG